MSLRPPLPRPRKTGKPARSAPAPKHPAAKPKPKPGNCSK